MNDDLISRSALKKAFKEAYAGITFSLIECNDIIDDALTVEDRPIGKWIIDGHHYKCSRCGKTLAIMFSETDDDLIGCPFCLADMRKEAENESSN